MLPLFKRVRRRLAVRKKISKKLLLQVLRVSLPMENDEQTFQIRSAGRASATCSRTTRTRRRSRGADAPPGQSRLAPPGVEVAGACGQKPPFSSFQISNTTPLPAKCAAAAFAIAAKAGTVFVEYGLVGSFGPALVAGGSG